MDDITKKRFITFLKRLLLVLLLLIFYITFSAVSYTNAICTNIADTVFRLHVVANSDSVEDQNLKYKVRDSIIDFINSITKDAKSKAEVITIAQEHLEEIEEIAYQTVRDYGYDYDVTVSIGNFIFPTKQYGDISLPAGYYDALRVEIGSASGQNWWCVMFPPLCFVDVTSGIVPDESKDLMKENLEPEEYNLISQSSPDIKFKFKIVEVLQNLNISGIFM